MDARSPADREPADGPDLTRRLRALAHPARLEILAELARSKTCHCGDIVRNLPLAQSTVSEHLRILRDAGLVRGEGPGLRPCYCLDRAAVKKLAADLVRLLAAIARHDEAPRLPARRGAGRRTERSRDARAE